MTSTEPILPGASLGVQNPHNSYRPTDTTAGENEQNARSLVGILQYIQQHNERINARFNIDIPGILNVMGSANDYDYSSFISTIREIQVVSTHIIDPSMAREEVAVLGKHKLANRDEYFHLFSKTNCPKATEEVARVIEERGVSGEAVDTILEYASYHMQANFVLRMLDALVISCAANNLPPKLVSKWFRENLQTFYDFSKPKRLVQSCESLIDTISFTASRRNSPDLSKKARECQMGGADALRELFVEPYKHFLAFLEQSRSDPTVQEAEPTGGIQVDQSPTKTKPTKPAENTPTTASNKQKRRYIDQFRGLSERAKTFNDRYRLKRNKYIDEFKKNGLDGVHQEFIKSADMPQADAEDLISIFKKLLEIDNDTLQEDWNENIAMFREYETLSSSGDLHESSFDLINIDRILSNYVQNQSEWERIATIIANHWPNGVETLSIIQEKLLISDRDKPAVSYLEGTTPVIEEATIIGDKGANEPPIESLPPKEIPSKPGNFYVISFGASPNRESEPRGSNGNDFLTRVLGGRYSEFDENRIRSIIDLVGKEDYQLYGPRELVEFIEKVDANLARLENLVATKYKESNLSPSQLEELAINSAMKSQKSRETSSSQSGFEDYLFFVTKRETNGKAMTVVVAECANTGNATYIYVDDTGNWENIFSDSKERARDLGAKRITHDAKENFDPEAHAIKIMDIIASFIPSPSQA